MFSRKGINPFIAFVLIVAISISATVIGLRLWQPGLEKSENFAMIEEAKGNLNSINSAIKEVSYEGVGSARRISLRVTGGEYRVSSSKDEVIYTLDSEYRLFPNGTDKREGEFYIKAHSNYSVNLILNYTKVDIKTDERWSRGSYTLLVKNNGTSADKVSLITKL